MLRLIIYFLSVVIARVCILISDIGYVLAGSGHMIFYIIISGLLTSSGIRLYKVVINKVLVFRSPHSAPTHRYTILDSRLLPCNAISEGRLPLCNTSSEAGALPSDKQYMIDLL